MPIMEEDPPPLYTEEEFDNKVASVISQSADVQSSQTLTEVESEWEVWDEAAFEAAAARLNQPEGVKKVEKEKGIPVDRLQTPTHYSPDPPEKEKDRETWGGRHFQGPAADRQQEEMQHYETKQLAHRSYPTAGPSRSIWRPSSSILGMSEKEQPSALIDEFGYCKGKPGEPCISGTVSLSRSASDAGSLSASARSQSTGESIIETTHGLSNMSVTDEDIFGEGAPPPFTTQGPSLDGPPYEEVAGGASSTSSPSSSSPLSLTLECLPTHHPEPLRLPQTHESELAADYIQQETDALPVIHHPRGPRQLPHSVQRLSQQSARPEPVNHRQAPVKFDRLSAYGQGPLTERDPSQTPKPVDPLLLYNSAVSSHLGQSHRFRPSSISQNVSRQSGVPDFRSESRTSISTVSSFNSYTNSVYSDRSSFQRPAFLPESSPDRRA